MNLKQFAGWVFMLAALAAAIGAMATLDWISGCDDNSDGGQSCYYYGLKRYKFTYTNSNGDSNSETGSISSLPDGSKYDSAGNRILEAGIPALFTMVTGCVLYCLYAAGKLRTTGALLAAVASSLASVVLVVLAMLLYAKEFYVSFCFTIYFVGALLFVVSTAVTVVAIFSDEISKGKVALALLVNVSGMAMVCAGLAIVSWFHMSDDSSDVKYGIMNYEVTVFANGQSNTQSGTLKSLKELIESQGGDASAIQNLIDAGNLALGFGIVGLVFAAAGVVLGVLMLAGKEGRVIGAAISANTVAALMVLVGTMTWAHKIHIGMSFVVWTTSGFLVLVGVALFVAGVSTGTSNGKVALAASADQPSTSGTHMLMPDHS